MRQNVAADLHASALRAAGGASGTGPGILGYLVGTRNRTDLQVEALSPVSLAGGASLFQASAAGIQAALSQVSPGHELLGIYHCRADEQLMVDEHDCVLMEHVHAPGPLPVLILGPSPAGYVGASIGIWNGSATAWTETIRFKQWAFSAAAPTPIKVTDQAVGERSRRRRWLVYATTCAAASIGGVLIAWGLAGQGTGEDKRRYVIVGSSAGEVISAPAVEQISGRDGEPLGADAQRRMRTEQSDKLDSEATSPSRTPEVAASDKRTPDPRAPREVASISPTSVPSGRTEPQPSSAPSATAATGDKAPAPSLSATAGDIAAAKPTPDLTDHPVAAAVLNRRDLPAPAAPEPPKTLATSVAPTAQPTVVPSKIVPPTLANQPRSVTVPADILRLVPNERTLEVRVAIDAAGRVTNVSPVGAQDKLDAVLLRVYRSAISTWRYTPATVNGTAAPSETIVRFRVRPSSPNSRR